MRQVLNRRLIDYGTIKIVQVLAAYRTSEYRNLAWSGLAYAQPTSVLHPVTVLLKRRVGRGGEDKGRKEGRKEGLSVR